MLSDTVCVVVGGAHGIGRATALGLSELGATVAVSDLGTSVSGAGSDEAPVDTVVEEIRDGGGEALAHHGDVSSLEDTAALVETVYDEYGRIDGAVNFAGILRDSQLHTMSSDDWDTVIDVHLRGTFSLFRSLSEHWRERSTAGEIDRQRSLLAVSSRSAFGNFGQANYAAAKAGILGLVRTAAVELPRFGVRTNALLPAAYTRMVDQIPDGKRPFSREEKPPERVVPLVAYLMSDDAADVNGCTFYAGGETVQYVSDPEATVAAYREGGWTAESLGRRFDEVFDGVALDKRMGITQSSRSSE